MLMNNRFCIILLFLLPILFLGGAFVLAQEDMAVKCALNNVESFCNTQPSSCRQLLVECDQYYQQETQKIEADLNKTSQEKKTLQSKVSTLNKQIKGLESQIYQSNLVIKDLGLQIEDTESAVDRTAHEIGKSQQELGAVLNQMYQQNRKGLPEILLTEDTLSGFFGTNVHLSVLSNKTAQFLNNIKVLKVKLEDQMVSLDKEKNELESSVKVQTLKKQENSKLKQENEYYLGITEKKYQEQLKEKEDIQKIANEIRGRIFELTGVSKAPTFGEAYEIAKYVEGITKVRTPFLLAILTQESNIGKNVGQCTLTDSKTGEGLRISSKAKTSKVMNPKRDVPHFLSIVAELGQDPYNTPVSCPLSYGWGGAMGPAQFIPSTWNIYRDRVRAVTGRPGSPWNITDAFVAAGLYLSDYGGKIHTYDSEWKAAMIYFSGTSKRTASNGYGFYGDSVVKITKQYEQDVKTLEAAQ